MNPRIVPLFRDGDATPQAWQCAVCNLVMRNQYRAKECHPDCSRCGKVVEMQWAEACRACQDVIDRERSERLDAKHREADTARVAALPTVPWPADGKHAFTWPGQTEHVAEEDAGSIADYCEKNGIPLPTRCEVWEMAVAELPVRDMVSEWAAGFDDEVDLPEAAGMELEAIVRGWAEKHNLREWRSTGTAAEYVR